MKKFIFTLFIFSIFLYSCNDSDNEIELPQELNLKLAQKAWVDTVLSFNPAPGQFQNLKPELSLLQQAQVVTGNTAHYVSLGTFGGNLVFQFDGVLENKPGDDLAIFGNSFEGSSEPAAVQISFDENQDGIPNDTWYELKGSEFDKPSTIKNYKITYFRPTDDQHKVSWKDNQGASGVLDFTKVKTFHPQEMYPQEYTESISFEGHKTLNNVSYEYSEKYGASIYFWKAYEWGYVDNKGYEQKDDLRGADLFDFDNAVDEEGKKAKLKHISFVRVYNPIFPSEKYGLTVLGERGAEISKAKYLHLD